MHSFILFFFCKIPAIKRIVFKPHNKTVSLHIILISLLIVFRSRQVILKAFFDTKKGRTLATQEVSAIYGLGAVLWICSV